MVIFSKYITPRDEWGEGAGSVRRLFRKTAPASSTQYEGEVDNPPSHPSGSAKTDAFETSTPATSASTPSDSDLNTFLSDWINRLSSTDINQIASAYADPVDYDDEGLLTRSKLLKSLRAYYTRWPVQNITLTTQPTVETLNATDSRTSFEIQFDASDPASGRRSRGVARMVIVVRRFGDGEFRIVTTREKIVRRF